MVKQKVSEASVLRACLDLLTAERIFHRRWNTGAVKADKRFFRFGQKGDADILAIVREIITWCDTCSGDIDLTVLWIECKSDSGKQSPEQKEFQREVEAAGHSYIVVNNPDVLKAWLKDHGCIR